MDRNTLAWSKCDICGRHGPVRRCSLKPELMVCPWCCLTCPLRDRCSKPAWFPELKTVPKKSKETKRDKSILSYISND